MRLLMGALLYPVESTRVLGRATRDLSHLHPEVRRDGFSDVHDVRRLVSTATARHGSEVRRVGLDEKSVLRNLAKQVDGAERPERGDARKRHVPTRRHGLHEGASATGEAVQHTERPRRHGPKRRRDVLVGVSRVHHDRQAELTSHLQMGVEVRALLRTRCAVIVIVEARLSDRDDLAVLLGEHADLAKALRFGVHYGVRVYTRGTPRPAPATNDLERASRIGDVGGDRDQTGDARVGGPTKHRLPVFPEGGVRQVAVTVEVFDHTVAG